MSMDLLQQFQDNRLVKAIASGGATTLLAVSGGVDSMVMAELFRRSGLPVAVAHCNFQLRGGEADKDEQLVRAWAERHGVAFHHTRFATKERMEEWKKGVQETARILRYEWLDALVSGHSYGRLATAHHANDNVETLLMNLFKGTGISGMHGVPEQNGYIVRPLLFARKEELYAYAHAHDIAYREDASNATDAYTRNAIRNSILPAIEQSFPNVVQHISDSIGRFAQAEQLYHKAVARELKGLKEQRGADIYVPVRKLLLRQPLETLCYELFHPYGFTPAQLPHILSLLGSGSGHFISSASHRIIRDREFLIITAQKQSDTDIISIEGVPCTVDTGSRKLHFSLQAVPGSLPADASTACIDAKNITFPLLLRKWRQGDYFYPLGMGMKKKKVARFLIDHKVPLHEKEQVWVLECDRRIVWVCGMRLDERFKTRPATEKVLLVHLSR
ncbi:MAG: tRNA lysidine(34) synthetase TilS [Flavipsychrobacter sp.]|nr:tRNA lysidine(34) synthetase TilS [Flavipsychrobacter sp.]